MIMIFPQCLSCTRLTALPRDDDMICEAFPNGTPAGILKNVLVHRQRRCRQPRYDAPVLGRWHFATGPPGR